MQTLRLGLLLVLLSSAFGVRAADTLTVDSVQALLDSIMANVDKRNAKAVVRAFAKDATITLELPQDLGGRMEMGRKKYGEMLRQSFATSSNYKYEVTNVKIALAADKRSAVVTDEVMETMEMGGITISTSTAERVEIVLVNGNPKVQTLYGKVKLLSPL